MSKVKDWLEGIPSPNTRKSYKNGIKKFEEYYGKGIETLIGSENAGKRASEFERTENKVIRHKHVSGNFSLSIHARVCQCMFLT